MIDLYTWPTPNGRKISILLEELEAQYNAIPINIGNNEQFQKEFTKALRKQFWESTLEGELDNHLASKAKESECAHWAVTVVGAD